MRRAAVAATAALCVSMLCLSTLAACDASSSGPATPSPTSEPTSGTTTGSTPSTPTSTGPTTPQPPVMPALARENSRPGAKAFVRYYVEVLNFSWHHLQPRLLDELSDRDCSVCQSVLEAIKVAVKNGGYQRGGEWVVIAIYSIPRDEPKQSRFLVKIHIQPGEWKPRSSSDVRNIVAQTVTNSVVLIRSSNGWQLTELSGT